MVTLVAPAQAPDNRARRRKKDEFFGKVNRLVGGLRIALIKAEGHILEAARNKWNRDNPPEEEFHVPDSESTHLAELETAMQTLITDIEAAIRESHAFE